MEPYEAEIPPACTVPNTVCVMLLKKARQYLPSRNCALGDSLSPFQCRSFAFSPEQLEMLPMEPLL